MGVKVTVSFGLGEQERVFPNATDWYIADEGFLDIYQLHDGDPEFVVMQYNKNAWETVEWDPPLPPDPQPERDTRHPLMD